MIVTPSDAYPSLQKTMAQNSTLLVKGFSHMPEPNPSMAPSRTQSCHLGVLDADRVVIIAHVNSPLNSGFYVKAGGIGDLMPSTTGQVILAHQTPKFLLEL
jgi:hypothetical protein